MTFSLSEHFSDALTLTLFSKKSSMVSFSMEDTVFPASIAIIISCFESPNIFSNFSTVISLFSLFFDLSLTIAIFLASSCIFRLICTMPSSRKNLCISPIIMGTAYVENVYPMLSSKRSAALVSPTAPI